MTDKRVVVPVDWSAEVRKHACSNHGCEVFALAGIDRTGMVGTNAMCKCFHQDFSRGVGHLKIQQMLNAIHGYRAAYLPQQEQP